MRHDVLILAKVYQIIINMLRFSTISFYYTIFIWFIFSACFCGLKMKIVHDIHGNTAKLLNVSKNENNFSGKRELSQVRNLKWSKKLVVKLSSWKILIFSETDIKFVLGEIEINFFAHSLIIFFYIIIIIIILKQ